MSLGTPVPWPRLIKKVRILQSIALNLDVPFTKFYGLINAIPRAWKNALKPHGQNNLNDTSTTPLITP